MVESGGDGDTGRLGATDREPIAADFEFEWIAEQRRSHDPHGDAGREAHLQEPQGRVVVAADGGHAGPARDGKLIQRRQRRRSCLGVNAAQHAD